MDNRPNGRTDIENTKTDRVASSPRRKHFSELILYSMSVFVDFSSPGEILYIDCPNSHSLTRATVYMLAIEGTRVIGQPSLSAIKR